MFITDVLGTVRAYAESAAEAWGILIKCVCPNRLMNKNVMRIGVSHDDPSITAANHIRYDICVNIDADITGEVGLKAEIFVLIEECKSI